jgi:MoxR-like ATPase
MPQLLAAGWALERLAAAEADVSADDLGDLSRRVYDVDLSGVTELYGEVVFKVRDLGVAFSDRRSIKVLKLLAASALLCGRERAAPSDLWVLRYVWDREEQIAPLAALVNGLLAQHKDGEAAHPLAAVPEQVDGEEIARQLDAVEREVQGGPLSLASVARLRERVADLADRATWVGSDRSRQHLLERTGKVLERLG